MSEDIQDEINKAYHGAEGSHASGKDVVAKELADNAMRADNIKNTLEVFDIFGGDGLADAMPLGEVKGFIDAMLSGEKRLTGKEVSEEEKSKLEMVYDFLCGLDKEEYHDEMELGALIEKLKKVEW